MNNAKKILIVDDDHDIREIIRLILDMEGFEVSELDSGHEVDAEIERFRPDVILLDVMLGDMDGRDICKHLKDIAITCAIPIIMVSATHDRHTMSEKTCGADDYLAKPFDVNDLVDRVKKQIAA
ncbi:response regulator [Mucilaginibacter terrigena]|uniref:Response regulator n=1 Tax=Mucilaginibacter terrigena TaxID=2492395 RepID=A0A4Q5LL64_9SPHI|nr:response regulator [Mucilaginibacter terrigena]RYU89590.1 response regulator [Mucilaginibacter terrigena]